MAFSQVSLPLISMGSCAQGLPGQGGGTVWWRGWPGGGPSIQCSAFPSSAFSSWPPSPDQYGLPLLRLPSLLFCQPSSLPPACPPPCALPPSSLSPAPRAPGPSAGGRRRPQRGEGEVAAVAVSTVVAAGGREAGPAGDQGRRLPLTGDRSPWPGPPPEALCWAPRDTPPSSAFLSSLLLSLLLIPLSRLPPSQLSVSSSTPSYSAPPLPSLSQPPACFSLGG